MAKNVRAAGIPLAWLIRQRELRLKVLAGWNGLDREVVWAHSIELADPVPWLRGGELVLTTGMRLPDTAAGRADYVRQLAGAGVTAVGFGVGLSHQNVPDELVEAAEEAGMPLLEVPLPTPFLAITKTLMERLAEQQYEDVVQASRIQPRMTRAALQGGVQAVVRELAVSTETDVLYLDGEGRTRAAHPPGTRTPNLLVHTEAPLPEQAAASMMSTQDGVAAVHQVRVGPRVHGRLVLAGGRALTPMDHLLLGHAASLLALEAEKPLRLRDEQHRVNGMFLCMLLNEAVTAPAAQDQLNEAGFPVRDGIRVLALRGGEVRNMLERAGEVLAEQGLPLFGTVHEGCAVLLLPGSHARTARTVADAASAHASSRAWAGMSGIHTLENGSAALRQALNAVSVAQSRGSHDVVSTESLAGQVLFTTPETRSVLESLAAARLGPLAAYDTSQGTELIASLRAFLEHHGHWEAASAALGVHRHTLRSRVERIRDLLDVDLDSAHVRAELLLSLSAWQEPGRDG
ncbi:PucR family transcriptional regulator [Streptomyces sp. NPDC004752]